MQSRRHLESQSRWEEIERRALAIEDVWCGRWNDDVFKVQKKNDMLERIGGLGDWQPLQQIISKADSIRVDDVFLTDDRCMRVELKMGCVAEIDIIDEDGDLCVSFLVSEGLKGWVLKRKVNICLFDNDGRDAVYVCVA